MSVRQKWLVRGSLLVFGGLFAALGLYLLATVPPEGSPIYPKCVSYTVLGFHCPGCGTTRALHALLQGRLQQSLAYNLIALPALVYLSLIAIRFFWQWCWGRPLRSWSWPKSLIWMAICLFLLYGILRNIPIEPFSYLAPHRLGG